MRSCYNCDYEFGRLTGWPCSECFPYNRKFVPKGCLGIECEVEL